jgi:hypothetical protein
MRATVSSLVLALTLSSLGMAQQQDAPVTPPPTHGTPQTKPVEAPATATKPVKKKKKLAAKPAATPATTDDLHGTPQTSTPK